MKSFLLKSKKHLCELLHRVLAKSVIVKRADFQDRDT